VCRPSLHRALDQHGDMIMYSTTLCTLLSGSRTTRNTRTLSLARGIVRRGHAVHVFGNYPEMEVMTAPTVFALWMTVRSLLSYYDR
jgi:hypothetical protein